MTNSSRELFFLNSIEGYSISPEQAESLEETVDDSGGSEPQRWKLLGYYYAHQSCCPDLRGKRLRHVLWEIKNNQDLEPPLIEMLMMFHPEDEVEYAAAKAAWLARVDSEPNNPKVLGWAGHFVSVFEPDVSIELYSRALALETGGEKQSKVAKLLDLARMVDERQKGGQLQYTERKPMTCYWDVLTSMESILEQTRQDCQPEPDLWQGFYVLVSEMKNSPMLLPLAHHGSMPTNSPAPELCRHALREAFAFYPADSTAGSLLCQPELKRLWDHLTTSPS